MRFETLEHPIRWLFIFHVVSGTIALLAFLIPLLSRKGGSLHVKSGWVYSCAMIFVGISALVITPWRALFDPDRTDSSISFAVFLFYVAVFTLSSIWGGIKVLKFKDRKAPSRALIHIGFPIATVVLGLAVQIIGWRLASPLLMIFPFLGHVTSYNQLTYWMRKPREKMHWWYQHMSAMFTACIATVTAFLVTAVPRIFPDLHLLKSPILWVGPGIILGTLLNRWTRRYRIKFRDQV